MNLVPPGPLVNPLAPFCFFSRTFANIHSTKCTTGINDQFEMDLNGKIRGPEEND